eukprot:TRINITY_DN20520_c0_g1_i1.p1 TRINITY_DN20520_c0_g1~~TRINITY_DN20520_c0_g1_i1.p1  ORF type:complete len:1155 (-),score=223.59 TRINITY_DN20520_c0_g1_i1:115-3579(-)
MGCSHCSVTPTLELPDLDPNGQLDPILLHFDVNKTVLFSDAANSKSVEDGVRESISELFWGTQSDVEGALEWTWTQSEPTCTPPEGFEAAKLLNYAQYCKKKVPIRSVSKELIRSWELVTDPKMKGEMEELLKSTMKSLEILPALRYTPELEAAGLTGTSKIMLPAIFALVAFLQRMRRSFAVLFRSFGDDHAKIEKEWNAFCEMRHPVYNHLLEGIGPMDGSIAGVPDRRIHHVHTLYRDAAGPLLILDMVTNGPAGASAWDMWARTKPRPVEDLRNGREFVRELKANTVEGISNIQEWMLHHVSTQATAALKDDWAWWQWNSQHKSAGKLLMLLPAVNGQGIKQVFFDDNIEHGDARIVDCRLLNGDQIPDEVALGRYISKVNPVLALNDNDYFLKIFKRLHGEDWYGGYRDLFFLFRSRPHARGGLCCFAETAGIPLVSADIYESQEALRLLFCYMQLMYSPGCKASVASPSSMLTEVFGKVVAELLRRTANQAAGQEEHFQRVLEMIAFQMQVKHLDKVPSDMLEASLPTDWLPVWDTLRPLLGRVGKHVHVLQPDDLNRSNPNFSFLSKGVQSYCAASALAQPTSGSQFQFIPPLDKLFADPWWTMTLDMLAEKWPDAYLQLLEDIVPNFMPTDGDSFLHAAARAGHAPCFQLLQQLPARFKTSISHRNKLHGQMPLHVAAGMGNDLFCRLLIDSGAKLDAEDTEYRWPMHVAMQEEHFTTAKLLADAWVKSKPAPPIAERDGAEKIATRLLAQQISETEFIEAFQVHFCELRYFGKADFVEQKRVMCALLAVYWIVCKQYDAFVRSQAEDARLSHESWGKLQEWTKTTVCLTKDVETVRAMLVFVAIMSVGKVKNFRKAFTPETEEFSESLIRTLQQVPELFPSFARLSEASRQTIISCLNASDFNFGQFLQAENTPANLLVLNSVSADKSVLGFFLFKIFAAMCGILGMKSLEGSLFMNDKMYGNFRLGLDTLGFLSSESPAEVYNRFLAERAKSQGLFFDAADAESRAVARLACMTRAFDETAGKQVLEAFRQLSEAERQQLAGFLNNDGITQKPAFLLYNAPNLLAGRNKELSLTVAMRMMLQVYCRAAKEYSSADAEVVTIMVDELAAYAAKCTDPEVFALTSFDISRAAGKKGDTQGMVSIIE